MKWKSVAKHQPEEGSTVLAFWGIERPGSFAVVTYARPGLWHDPEDDEDDFREPEWWTELPPSPFDERDAANGSMNKESK